jgi:ribose transport system substrate-binding protein
MKKGFVLALCLAAACSKAGDKPADSTQTATAGGGKKLTIAMIGKSSNNPVFLAARTGAEAAAKELSSKENMAIDIAWLTPPQEDGEVQAQRIRQAVNDGAGAILIAASDAGKVTGAINDAVDRGVEVMTFDSDAPQSKRFAYYGVDDLKTGQLMMAELVKQLGGKGRVAILAGNQNAPNLQRRVQGAKDEAAKHPGIQVEGVFNHVETPQDAAAEVIRVNNAYPGITGWGFIGGWPLYTQTLLTDLNPARQKVVSVDALPIELPYVERNIVPVLLAQPVYNWGKVGVETIVDRVVHKKSPAAPVMSMDLVRVSKDNLGQWARQLKDWGFTDVQDKYLKM